MMLSQSQELALNYCTVDRHVWFCEHVHCAVHTTYAHSWELMIEKVNSINNLLKALTQNVTSVNH